MQRLTPLDASFLSVESPSAHMHVGWLSMLELPQGSRDLDLDLMRRRIESRLHLVPRFRQRVRRSALGEPYLVDDPSFDLGRHITVLAESTDRRGLSACADRFLSERLDRRLPLWSLGVVPRVRGGRAAVVGKIHHALVDGVAAVELGALLFDLDPTEEPGTSQEWSPRELAGALRFELDSAADGAVEQFRRTTRMATMGLRPRRTLRAAETMRRAALSVAEDVAQPAPPSYLNGRIGRRRALLTRSVAFTRLDRLKRRLGVKLNDLLLVLVCGALRRFAAVCDQDPGSLRAMVPVNVRSDEGGEFGNRIVFGLVELPVEEADPLRRAERISSQTDRLRAPEHLAGSDALMSSIGLLPGPLRAQAARLVASPRTYNLTISNLPGPRVPLYVAGARVKSIHPVIPLSDGHALSIGALSYGGALHFGLHADPVALSEAAELPGLIMTAVTELEARLTPHGPAPPARVKGPGRSAELLIDAPRARAGRAGSG